MSQRDRPVVIVAVIGIAGPDQADAQSVVAPRRSSQACTRLAAGAGKYDIADGMVSSLVPNASGRLDSGQWMSNAGSAPPNGKHCQTPGSPDNSGCSASLTTSMTRAPRAATIGT